MSCRDYEKGKAPLTSHRWTRDRGWFQPLQCATCGAGLYDEGVEHLAHLLQAERDELLAYEGGAMLSERDLALVMAEDAFQADDCEHQWTDSMVIQGEDGAKVFVCCSRCDEQMKLSDFLMEKHNGL